REALHWAVTTGGFNSETVQDVMLGAVERRFGNELPASPVEWLTDNGSCYRANETRQFARMLGLEPKSTAVRSPESNGIAESFVKTIKRDYISVMPKPDGLTAAKNLAEAFEHYNEWHPHREGANKRGNSSRLTQSFHFFMFEPIFSPVNALNQPI
ncbi:integrase core domain-containing protein, partial [Escherichia coli]|uniref:integrase core domain-containing protein n=1 Tax=Escherichia coli TaxID=562 RepID=UPI0034591C87